MKTKPYTQNGKLYFEPIPDEIIEVVYWAEYPSYEFIFGIPTKDSSRHEKEVGFYLFRDKRTTKDYAHYLDAQELLDCVHGMQEILLQSQANSPELWQKHHAKQRASEQI